MSAHTPGKWIVHPKFPNYIVPESHADRPIGAASDPEVDLALYAQTIAIASFKNWHRKGRHRKESECAANARLIACAPEMLEALRWYALVEGDTRAAAIVAKATGQQP